VQAASLYQFEGSARRHPLYQSEEVQAASLYQFEEVQAASLYQSEEVQAASLYQSEEVQAASSTSLRRCSGIPLPV